MTKKIKTKITIDTDTLRLADRLARRMKTSRNAILRNEVRALADSDQREEEQGPRRAIGRRSGADAIAANWPSEAIVHAFRYPWEEKSQLL